MSDVPKAVRLVEVGPRDGLQNESIHLPAAVRADLITRLAEAGLTHIEAGAFVSPRWVPQMAATAEVMSLLPQRDGVSYPVLVPNEKGLDAALEAGTREIAIFAAASQSFSQRNINCSIEDSMERFAPVTERALAAGLKVRGYVSCVLGCPYEGEVDPGAVAWVARELRGLGCYEISLGDTIGVGTPGRARGLVKHVSQDVPLTELAVHFHDTYGQALANIYACLLEGVSVVDASVAGLGGCPYAAGASGNVATEDVVYMLNGLGIRSGVDLDRLVAAGNFISQQIRQPSRSRVALARGGDASREEV
ncbi:hydroxymethylglutaryl-CoA lyase [Fodinicurvata fenggangensis]|uniref:hydroxymethylglutaryl-CoA lyase n=1 Tax=Fodinicurvata fenggangensis TaxID=1121830 RepID=UPI00047C70D2|nr:hydroxymethylglutaryl-CoA lyase [Fodinicurvata fenggangensis]